MGAATGITLDGAAREGGGQILRSALALSIITGQPFVMRRIRARRKKPGLQAQHLTCVLAAAEISGAKTRGAELHSQELRFEPGPVQAGDYAFSIGTAGSTTLVLQTVLPPLWQAKGASRVCVTGGTHNPMAPPFEFLERAFFPLIDRLGTRHQGSVAKAGFYPQGGGRVEVEITPTRRWTPLHLETRGELRRCQATAVIAQLPQHVAQRELSAVQRALGWDENQLQIEQVRAASPGNVLLLELAYEHATEICAGFGERGVRAEEVAAAAIAEAQNYLAGNHPVGPHLADQLILPLSLAGGAFVTCAPTPHTTTNIETVRSFLPVQWQSAEVAPGEWRFSVARGHWDQRTAIETPRSDQSPVVE